MGFGSLSADFRRLAVFCVLLLVNGCILSWKPTSKGHIEKVEDWKTDYLIYAGQGATTLEGHELTISIRPQNEEKSSGVMLFPVPMPLSSWGSETDAKFWITVEIRSKTQRVSLDPFGFRLEIENSTVTPSRVVQRDVTPEIYLQCTLRGTAINPREVVKGNRTDLWPPACFDIYFEIPMLSVNQEFYFVVGGLDTGDGSISIPKIKFAGGTSPSGW